MTCPWEEQAGTGHKEASRLKASTNQRGKSCFLTKQKAGAGVVSLGVAGQGSSLQQAPMLSTCFLLWTHQPGGHQSLI